MVQRVSKRNRRIVEKAPQSLKGAFRNGDALAYGFIRGFRVKPHPIHIRVPGGTKESSFRLLPGLLFMEEAPSSQPTPEGVG